MDITQIVFTLKDAKISYKDDKWHVSGQPQRRAEIAEECKKLDGIDKVESSHLYRVIFGEADPSQESDYISIATSYDITVGVTGADGFASLLPDTKDVPKYRGDLKIKVTARVLEHTERGKTKKYLTFYPGVIVLPADWEEHEVDLFSGM